MSNLGHNEKTFRLAALAGDAQIALDKVAKGETDAIEGWLAYGAALNEGRALFPGDREFGQWLSGSSFDNLSVRPNEHEQVAAMWAAANADQLAEAKAASKARTLRGWHDQWKKIEADRDAARLKAERDAETARKREEAKKEAEARAKAEAEARAKAEAATSDDDRREYEAEAEKAAAAKVEAEKAVQEVEAEIQSEEPEQDPETAKLRREIGKLTTEGMIDEIIGLRADLADAKASAKTLKAERDDLKAKLADLTADDQQEVIRRLQASLKNAENAKWRAIEEQARIQKQVYALKKRVEELEQMGVVTL